MFQTKNRFSGAVARLSVEASYHDDGAYVDTLRRVGKLGRRIFELIDSDEKIERLIRDFTQLVPEAAPPVLDMLEGRLRQAQREMNALEERMRRDETGQALSLAVSRRIGSIRPLHPSEPDSMATGGSTLWQDLAECAGISLNVAQALQAAGKLPESLAAYASRDTNPLEQLSTALYEFMLTANVKLPAHYPQSCR